jgi:hypothetical protein
VASAPSSYHSEKDSRAGSATSTWSFAENGQAYDATFKAVAHAQAALKNNSWFIAVIIALPK